MVTLYCNATGQPAPIINWTRVWENSTDSEQLPVVDGSYIMSNIKRSSNGMYRCIAYNGVGDPVNRTVNVIVRCKYERELKPYAQHAFNKGERIIQKFPFFFSSV